MIQSEIERLSALRQELWAKGDPDHEVPELTARIEELYERQRREKAEELHGDPDKIRARARIESELERLMSD